MDRVNSNNPVINTNKLPPPIDLTRHYSALTKDRKVSKVKGFYKYYAIPNLVSLAGGLPNNNYFPFDTLEATAALPDRWKPTPNTSGNVAPPKGRDDLHRIGTSNANTKNRDSDSGARVLVPKTSDSADIFFKIDLKTVLQYGTAVGFPPLLNYIKQFVEKNLHPNVPYDGGPEVILTTGATDGFSKSLEALSNPWHETRDGIEDREGILVEEFAYMNAVQTAQARGLNIVPVAVDDQGMCNEGPGGLLDVLENWDVGRGKRPYLIYTVSIGQNPTSGVLSLHRRRAIYDLCVKFDVIIIEDDPYWFLQYPSANSLSIHYRNEAIAHDFVRPGDPYNATRTPYWNSAHWAHPDPRKSPSDWKSSGFPFLDSLVPSYLAVDYQGRVVRLDTFSKTIAPGCRLGWITTQPALCERLLRITETATQQPSGFVQGMVAELLIGPQDSRKDFDVWQTGGWVRWLEGLRGEYERRMQIMCTILEEGRQLIQTKRLVMTSRTKRSFPTDRNTASSALYSSSGPSPANNRSPASSEQTSDFTTANEWTDVTTTPIFTFPWPQGGMFVWVHFHFQTHPLYPIFTTPTPINPSASPLSAHKLAEALFVHLTRPSYRILICPGVMFSPTTQIAEEKGWQYVRLCFAAVEKNQVKEATEAFVRGVRDFWEIRDMAVVEALRGNDEEMGWGPGEWADRSRDEEKESHRANGKGLAWLDFRGGC